MSSSNSYQSFSETKLDFKLSWNLLKENWKAFISTILFAGVFLFLLAAILFILVHFIPNFFILDITQNFANIFTRLIYFLSRFFIILITIFVFFAFLSCQYGLAYDIMSSGDMFAEFKGSFTYFRRHWWQYSLLMILISWGIFLPGRDPVPPQNRPILNLIAYTIIETDIFSIIRDIIVLIFYFFWFIIFINTLPSVTSKGYNKEKVKFSQIKNFKNSFIESFRIFRKYPMRLLTTWAIFFLIFFIPLITGIIVSRILFQPFVVSQLMPILRIINTALWANFIFIGTPMMALLATRIYNSIELENSGPIKKSEQNLTPK
ncbi:MAG: hypothetical protein ACFFDN_10025 [Candidatus Hodarchaeota archaeon]